MTTNEAIDKAFEVGLLGGLILGALILGCIIIDFLLFTGQL